DGHENGDDVAFEDEPHHTQSEQDGAQHQKVRSRNHISPRNYRNLNRNLRGAPGPTRPAVQSRSKTTSAQTETRIRGTAASKGRASKRPLPWPGPDAKWRAQSRTPLPPGTRFRAARQPGAPCGS